MQNNSQRSRRATRTVCAPETALSLLPLGLGVAEAVPSAAPPKPIERSQAHPGPDADATASDMLRRATGCSSQEFGFLLFQQAVAALPSKKDEPSSEAMRSALAALEEIRPRDGMEGMLAAQLLSLHSVAMDHLSRAAHPDQSPERRDKYVNNAAKLTRAFAQQLEALQRYRGKGQQKATVEHVHVHSGGQAIVGAVAASGGKGERE